VGKNSNKGTEDIKKLFDIEVSRACSQVHCQDIPRVDLMSKEKHKEDGAASHSFSVYGLVSALY